MLLNKTNKRSGFMRWLDRHLTSSYWRLLLWLFIAFTALFILFCGLLVAMERWGGANLNLGENGANTDIGSAVFMILTDPGNLSSVFPGGVSIGIWLIYAVIAIVGAVLFSSLLVSLLSNVVERRVEQVRSGEVDYQLGRHFVVIGFDAMVPRLVRQIRSAHTDSDILLLTRRSSEEVRESLLTLLSEQEMRSIVLYNGRRDSLQDLERCCLNTAREVYIIGNRDSQDHDALNIDCLAKLITLVSSDAKPRDIEQKLPVHLLLENHTTHSILQTTNLAKNWNEWVRVIPFSFYESWARQVLYAPEYPHLLLPEGDDKATAEVVIVGLSRMGLTIATEVAHRLHFPNHSDGRTRHTRITLVSPEADSEMRHFRTRYRQIFEIQSMHYTDLTADKPKTVVMPPTRFSGPDADFLDIDFHFVRSDGRDERFHEMLLQRLESDASLEMSLFVTTGNDDIDTAIALYLPDAVQQRCNIFLRQKHTSQLIDWLRVLNEQTGGRYRRIYPFGMLDAGGYSDPQAQRRAVLINYFYNKLWTEPEHFADDHRITPDEWREALRLWNDETSVANQWSSYYCSLGFQSKMELFGLSPLKETDIPALRPVLSAHIETLSCVEHNRWNMERLLMGCRKPNAEEQAAINTCRMTEPKQDRVFKEMKNLHLIHDYLRSYDDLLNVHWLGMRPQDNIQKIDYDILSHIPWFVLNQEPS